MGLVEIAKNLGMQTSRFWNLRDGAYHFGCDIHPMDYFCFMLLTHVAIVSYLRDGLRDKTSQNSEKIREITSLINPTSLLKKTECT